MVFVGFWLGIMAFGQDTASGTAPAGPSTAMGVLQPAVLNVQQTMDSLRVEKWKAAKEVKAETTQNIGSIRRDVEATLPGLVTAADAAPASLAAMLPLTRNVGALYDVVLRVTVIAESAAPGDQADALEKSLSGLDAARRTLADRQQQMAATEDAKVAEMQKQLNARPAVAELCPPAAVSAPVKNAPAAAAKRRRKRARPSAKVPAASAKASGSGAG